MEKKKRGFAGMDAEKKRQIQSMGGKAAHAAGTAHKWTSETGRDAYWAKMTKQGRTE